MQPSCYLNKNWYLPPGALSEFYIRFTCNGFTPTLGCEIVKVTYGPDELVEAQAFSDPSDPGLVGPFPNYSIKGPNPGDTPQTYAYIYYQSNLLANPPRPIRTLFSFYEDVGILGDWDYACALQLLSGSCDKMEGYQYVNQVFTQTDPPPSECNLFVKRVSWKKFGSNLLDLSSSTEVINGKSCKVYNIDFSGLYLVKETGWFKLMNPSICEFEEQDLSSNYATRAEIDSPTECSPEFIAECDNPDPCIDFIYCWELYAIPYAATLSGSQFIILSNSDGSNPVFPTLNAGENYYIITGECSTWLCDFEDEISETDISNTIVENLFRWRYELALTPSNLF